MSAGPPINTRVILAVVQARLVAMEVRLDAMEARLVATEPLPMPVTAGVVAVRKETPSGSPPLINFL